MKADVAGIAHLDVNNLGITDLTGIEHFTSLERLECGGNQVEALDLSGLTALETVLCHTGWENGALRSLNVSDCISLTEYMSHEDRLETLNLSVSNDQLMLQKDPSRTEVAALKNFLRFIVGK